jgi:hypothetical protein
MSVAMEYYMVNVILLGGRILLCSKVCALIYDTLFYFLDAAVCNGHSMAWTR